ncbi:MAG: hypothetical protein VKP63_04925 [Cyanobacteriota bacterium]|nr:hypothetical protein [Cyanobacteriota bacterium]
MVPTKRLFTVQGIPWVTPEINRSLGSAAVAPTTSCALTWLVNAETETDNPRKLASQNNGFAEPGQTEENDEPEESEETEEPDGPEETEESEGLEKPEMLFIIFDFFGAPLSMASSLSVVSFVCNL